MNLVFGLVRKYCGIVCTLMYMWVAESMGVGHYGSGWFKGDVLWRGCCSLLDATVQVIVW